MVLGHALRQTGEADVAAARGVQRFRGGVGGVIVAVHDAAEIVFILRALLRVLCAGLVAYGAEGQAGGRLEQRGRHGRGDDEAVELAAGAGRFDGRDGVFAVAGLDEGEFHVQAACDILHAALVLRAELIGEMAVHEADLVLRQGLFGFFRVLWIRGFFRGGVADGGIEAGLGAVFRGGRFRRFCGGGFLCCAGGQAGDQHAQNEEGCKDLFHVSFLLFLFRLFFCAPWRRIDETGVRRPACPCCGHTRAQRWRRTARP